MSCYRSWGHKKKSKPVLSVIVNLLSDIHQFIINSDKFLFYKQSYDSLLYSPSVQSSKQYLNLSTNDLKNMFCSMVNAVFLNCLNVNYSNFIAIYTDGSVSPLSAGYAFYIPELHVSFTNNLPPSSSSFTAEYYDIIEALFLSQILPQTII